MNSIQIISSQPWVEHLGWTLIHFLWQGVAIAVLYAAARRGVARTSSSNVRYLLGCAALAAMMAAPLVTWELMRPSVASPVADAAYRTPSPRPTAFTTGIASISLPASVRATVSGVRLVHFFPWVVTAWLAGAVAFWLRLAGGWVVAARLRSVRVRHAPQEWQDKLRKLSARMGLSRSIGLLVSALVEVPTVVGWMRPVVLVPVGALSGMPPGHIEALLLHELAHIRRHDYLVNLLQGVAEALLFYHPAVWWVSRHIRAEREMCCDDAAVLASGDAFTYARALAQLESSRPRLTIALGANAGSLSYRIARLLGQPRPVVRVGLGPGVLAVAILLVVAAYGLLGQSEARPAFKAVSIKQNTSNVRAPNRDPIRVSYQPGGELIAQNASLMLLIQFAYAAHDNPMLGHWLPLPASQVVGDPDWINSLRYDIETVPEGKTDPNQMWLMLQTLLADRFKLRLHRETRNLPIYELTSVGNGPKLPAATEASCVSFPPGTTPRHVPGKVDCGYVAGPFEGYASRLHIEGRKVHIADLMRELALILDRPILDKTDFNGQFDLNLSFTPDQALIGFHGPRGPLDPILPNIFAALEEQLGLKLVPAKGPVEVLVIDRAERPAEN